MIYDFTKDIKYDVAREIDVAEMKIKLEEKFEFENEAALFKQIKIMIKKEVTFFEFLDEYNLDLKEFINILIFAYPEMFNHHLVKYIRKKYIYKEKSEFEKL